MLEFRDTDPKVLRFGFKSFCACVRLDAECHLFLERLARRRRIRPQRTQPLDENPIEDGLDCC